MSPEGADLLPWLGGVVSGIHDEADIEQTCSAFEKMILLLAEDENFARFYPRLNIHRAHFW